MQLRKQHRKQIRNVIPCRWCGNDEHKTKECPKVSLGGKKRKQEREYRSDDWYDK